MGSEKIVGLAQDVGIERAGQTALAGQDNRKDSLLRTLREKRMLRLGDAPHGRAQHARELFRVGTRGKRRFLRAAQPGRGDEFHRAGDLLGVLH